MLFDNIGDIEDYICCIDEYLGFVYPREYENIRDNIKKGIGFKQAKENPIINYDAFYLLSPYFTKWVENNPIKYENPDKHLPIWIYNYLPIEQFKIVDYYLTSRYSYNKHDIPYYHVILWDEDNGNHWGLIDELEYYLNHFIEWSDNLNIFIMDESEELFNELKNEFLHPEWRKIIMENNLEHLNHNLSKEFDEWSEYGCSFGGYPPKEYIHNIFEQLEKSETNRKL